MITCCIRYELDPYRIEDFETYARAWGRAIPACGADLIGYFAPHEGSATTGMAMFNIENLAAYEAYRERLKTSEAARRNFAFAKTEQFIRREERTFLRLVSTPHAPMLRV